MKVVDIMHKDIKRYSLINIIIVIISFYTLVLLGLKMNANYELLITDINTLGTICIFFVFFVVLHSIKMFRFYLISMSKKIKMNRFIKLYIKTTFVNITLPLKLGEIFRIYCYGREMKDYMDAIVIVLVERFFDICTLLILLVPIEIVVNNRLSELSMLLIISILLLFISYWVFPAFYQYLSKVLIFNVKGNKSLIGLKVIENMNEWYCKIKDLVVNKASFIFILSLITWILEYLMFKGIALLNGNTFSLLNFSCYLNSVIGNSTSNVTGFYTLCGAVVLGIMMLILYLAMERKKENGK